MEILMMTTMMRIPKVVNNMHSLITLGVFFYAPSYKCKENETFIIYIPI